MESVKKSSRDLNDTYDQLECREEMDIDEYPLHEEQEKQHVTVSSMRPESSVGHYRLLVISLAVLAVVLLTVDIGLGIYYSKLTGGYTVTDIHGEFAKLQKTHDQLVQSKQEAQKQLVKEKRDHQFTKWELEHQSRTSSDLRRQVEKIEKDVSVLKSHLPLLEEGCRHCVAGWTLIGSKCYYFAISNSHSSMSWYDARRYCKAANSDLIILNSREKQLAIIEFLTQYRDPTRPLHLTGFWTGLTDEEQEGYWKWVDGTRLSEGYWHAGEPNNQGNEDCAAVYPSDNPFKSWNDAPCTYGLKWICEMEPTSIS
ncbi:unnamed protein product [Ophioblennius macclurei]